METVSHAIATADKEKKQLKLVFANAASAASVLKSTLNKSTILAQVQKSE